MASELTPAECAILIVLMAEAREVSNIELQELYGLDVRKPSREKLNEQGLVKSSKSGRTYVHVLDDDGWVRVEKELNFAAPQGRALGGALAALHKNLRDRVLPRTDFETFGEMFSRGAASVSASPRSVAPQQLGDLELRIRKAYAALTVEPGEWIGLAQLRPFFGDVPRHDFDEALRQLNRDGIVNIAPESNQKTLTADDVAAAVHIGNQAKHLLAMGAR